MAFVSYGRLLLSYALRNSLWKLTIYSRTFVRTSIPYVKCIQNIPWEMKCYEESYHKDVCTFSLSSRNFVNYYVFLLASDTGKLRVKL